MIVRKTRIVITARIVPAVRQVMKPSQRCRNFMVLILIHLYNEFFVGCYRQFPAHMIPEREKFPLRKQMPDLLWVAC
jgi:hypothetical protein